MEKPREQIEFRSMEVLSNPTTKMVRLMLGDSYHLDMPLTVVKKLVENLSKAITSIEGD